MNQLIIICPLHRDGVTRSVPVFASHFMKFYARMTTSIWILKLVHVKTQWELQVEKLVSKNLRPVDD